MCYALGRKFICCAQAGVPAASREGRWLRADRGRYSMTPGWNNLSTSLRSSPSSVTEGEVRGRILALSRSLMSAETLTVLHTPGDLLTEGPGRRLLSDVHFPRLQGRSGRTPLSGGGTSHSVGKKRSNGSAVKDEKHRNPNRCVSALLSQEGMFCQKESRGRQHRESGKEARAIHRQDLRKNLQRASRDHV